MFFRFIDDLLSLNDDGEFARSFREIYPPEMEIKQENKICIEASYLEMGLTITNKKVTNAVIFLLKCFMQPSVLKY